jgi:hypothetical protein
VAELAEIQGWMQRAIFAGGAREDFAESLVAGDGRLAPAERVAIYARGYRARLLECLRAEYPALRRLAGDTAFDLFAADYVATHPPRRPSLYDFGAGFADHLAERAPDAARGKGSLLAVPAQLARLERARAEVSRARAAVGPVEPGAPLRLPDTVRLLRLDFDFAGLIEAVEGDAPPPAPVIRETRLAVTRIGSRLRMLALEESRFAFLEGLAGRALAPPFPEALAPWLPVAARLGLVAPA